MGSVMNTVADRIASIVLNASMQASIRALNTALAARQFNKLATAVPVVAKPVATAILAVPARPAVTVAVAAAPAVITTLSAAALAVAAKADPFASLADDADAGPVANSLPLVAPPSVSPRIVPPFVLAVAPAAVTATPPVAGATNAASPAKATAAPSQQLVTANNASGQLSYIGGRYHTGCGSQIVFLGGR